MLNFILGLLIGAGIACLVIALYVGYRFDKRFCKFMEDGTFSLGENKKNGTK